MELTAKVIDPSADPRWDSFVLKHCRGTIYHLSSWTEVIRKTFGYTPCYSILEDDTGRIRGGVALFYVKSFLTGERLISVPFADSCDPLIESPEDLPAAIEQAKQAVCPKRRVSVKLCITENRIGIESQGFRLQQTYKNHVLALDELRCAGTLDEVGRYYRYNVRKAREAGVKIRHSETKVDLGVFYCLYVETRKRHGLLPMPFSFYTNMWEAMAPKGMFHLVLAELQGKIIAGILLLRYRDVLYAHMNASLSRYLPARPNHLLWWESIEMAKESEMRLFDFGRTAQDNVGLADFKRRWGACERSILIYVRPDAPRGNYHFDGHRALQQRLGPLVSRVPSAILRIAGSLAYGHFA